MRPSGACPMPPLRVPMPPPPYPVIAPPPPNTHTPQGVGRGWGCPPTEHAQTQAALGECPAVQYSEHMQVQKKTPPTVAETTPAVAQTRALPLTKGGGGGGQNQEEMAGGAFGVDGMGSRQTYVNAPEPLVGPFLFSRLGKTAQVASPWRGWVCDFVGVFAQLAHSAGTAPIITVIIQVTTLKTTHLRNHAQSIQNSKIQTSDACHGSQGPNFCPL